MILTKPIHNVINQLQNLLLELSDEQYTTKIQNLSGASIGQHIRHVVELFIELEKGYVCGTVNYEKRERDFHIEQNRIIAFDLLETIRNQVSKVDKELLLESNFSTDNQHIIITKSNYFRELIYNIEHAVHHMALIRVAVKELTNVSLPPDFGVATSTIRYRQVTTQ